MKNTIILTGNNLTPDEVFHFVQNSKVKLELSPKSLERVKKARAFIDQEMKKKVIYGVNTGFGPMASHIISSDKLIDLQENLIRSHAAGVGEPIDPDYVLSAMVVRLNTLMKGHSGISTQLAKHFTNVINHRIIPVIPEHGAVGTSGDLVQLAHIALTLIGEGEVWYKGERKPTQEVFKKLKIKLHKLQPKEGLALINGTSVMAGISVILLQKVNKLFDYALQSSAFALEMAQAFDDALSPRLHAVRSHKGQVHVARRLRAILKTSKLLQSRPVFNKNQHITRDTHMIPEEVQHVYSLRCTPQILGPVYDAIQHFTKILQVEINAVTDNPVVDWERKQFLHGGNFHGDYISYAVDQLKMTIVKLTMLSERRVNFFLHEKINGRFPPFLNLDTPGLTLGLQGLQFVATSTTAQSQTLAFPQYVHSIPTNADNQDVVSMGTDAALLFAKVVDNAFAVIAIELVTLSQALDITNGNGKSRVSQSTKKLFTQVRKIVPTVKKDRQLSVQVTKLANYLQR